MVASFKGLQKDIDKQMAEHKDFRKKNTDKLLRINAKVDVEMPKQIKEVNFAAEDLSKRLFTVQTEQIKPLSLKNEGMQEEIEKLQKDLEDFKD